MHQRMSQHISVDAVQIVCLYPASFCCCYSPVTNRDGLMCMQADSTRAGVKDLDVLLADSSVVLILDDTEHVWERHRANLIQVCTAHHWRPPHMNQGAAAD